MHRRFLAPKASHATVHLLSSFFPFAESAVSIRKWVEEHTRLRNGAKNVKHQAKHRLFLVPPERFTEDGPFSLACTLVRSVLTPVRPSPTNSRVEGRSPPSRPPFPLLPCLCCTRNLSRESASRPTCGRRRRFSCAKPRRRCLGTMSECWRWGGRGGSKVKELATLVWMVGSSYWDK